MLNACLPVRAALCVLIQRYCVLFDVSVNSQNALQPSTLSHRPVFPVSLAACVCLCVGQVRPSRQKRLLLTCRPSLCIILDLPRQQMTCKAPTTTLRMLLCMQGLLHNIRFLLQVVSTITWQMPHNRELVGWRGGGLAVGSLGEALQQLRAFFLHQQVIYSHLEFPAHVKMMDGKRQHFSRNSKFFV